MYELCTWSFIYCTAVLPVQWGGTPVFNMMIRRISIGFVSMFIFIFWVFLTLAEALQYMTPLAVCVVVTCPWVVRACVSQLSHAHTHTRIADRNAPAPGKKKKGQDDTHGKLCRRHGTHGLPWTIPYHSVFFYISLSSHAISSNPNPVQQVGFTTRNRHDTENQNTGNQSFPPPPPSYHLI